MAHTATRPVLSTQSVRSTLSSSFCDLTNSNFPLPRIRKCSSVLDGADATNQEGCLVGLFQTLRKSIDGREEDSQLCQFDIIVVDDYAERGICLILVVVTGLIGKSLVLLGAGLLGILRVVLGVGLMMTGKAKTNDEVIIDSNLPVIVVLRRTFVHRILRLNM